MPSAGLRGISAAIVLRVSSLLMVFSTCALGSVLPRSNAGAANTAVGLSVGEDAGESIGLIICVISVQRSLDERSASCLRVV